VKKGRSVGDLVVLATQKGTGDAIPTEIRDVCPVSLSYACKTMAAAIAALGEDIREYPEANPVTLQDPLYIGVASMVVQGRPGFTRIRTPLVEDADATAACVASAELTSNPLETLPQLGAVGDLDREDRTVLADDGIQDQQDNNGSGLALTGTEG